MVQKKDLVLVTGGAGFIGSSIADELLKRNYRVRIIDNFCTGRIENIKHILGKIELVKGDIRDEKLVGRIMRGVGFVFHEAALRSVPRSIDDPGSTNDVNITGTLNLLIAAKNAKVKRFIYASSSSVYGDTKELPKKELQKPQPISPYAVSKLTGEYYCQVFSKTYGLETVSLRYFNVFGPRQDPESKYAVVVPIFIYCGLKNKPFEVHSDGKQSRDFTYIDNVVNANILAMTAKNVSGKILNVACNDKHSILEIAYNVGKVLGIKPKFIFGPKRAGDVRHTLADITLAKKFLGYKPLVNFEDGMKKTVEYFREFYA
ncbi:MAG TPA: LPS biosynthesis protein WbpP [Elusimicrobia bacterium]|nr:LPS biosynthesis protein WbpP [Elusimicrobiota bacterium]